MNRFGLLKEKGESQRLVKEIHLPSKKKLEREQVYLSQGTKGLLVEGLLKDKNYFHSLPVC